MNDLPPAWEPPSTTPPLPETGFVTALEALLRQPERVVAHFETKASLALSVTFVIIALFCLLIYGAVMGSFSGGSQWWQASAKTVLGMLGSALICLPSLYIFSCLGGARVNLRQVCGLAAGMLALTSLLLIGFAPVAWVFSQSTQSIPSMGAFHLTFWAVSVYFGLRFMHHGFERFDLTSGAIINLWTLIFLVVSLQMSTALRPLIGKSNTFLPQEKQFFLSHWQESLHDAKP